MEQAPPVQASTTEEVGKKFLLSLLSLLDIKCFLVSLNGFQALFFIILDPHKVTLAAVVAACKFSNAWLM